MKLKYIIPILMAVIAAVFTSCSDDTDPTLLNSIQVSSSYIGIGQDGGSKTITVNAASDWAFASQQWTDGKDTVTAAVPQWLSVSQTSGQAGQTELTFSAEKATESHEVELRINCGGEVQRIQVVQQAEETDPVVYTVTEALAMIKAGTQGERAVRVKGIVCKITEISPQYGNATYYLSDDGTYGTDNWLQVYRGSWLNGQKFTQGNEFAVGDELVISGVLILYGGNTPETSTGTCEVISIKKSLIGIGGVELLGAAGDADQTVFPMEGGQARITVNSKGNGFHISIPAEAKSWLHIADFGADYVTVEADANQGGDRSVTVILSTVAGGTTYSCEQTFTQKGAIVAATVAEFNAAETGDTQYRLTGVITRVANAGYGNYYIADYSGETYVYGTGSKGDFEAMGLKEGDIVTVVGKRDQYKETIEMTGSTVEDIISVTEVSIADFLTKEDNPNVYYKVTGTVDEIANDTYGNLYISDGDARVYSYGCYPGWGATGDARKNCLADKGIAVGDKLTLIGVKSTYNGTPQLNGGIYFSHQKPE